MNIHLHKNARTTPAIRLELQAQAPSVSNRELAERYNLNCHTVAKWRQRTGTEDASHRPHQLHATLSPAQEAVVVALRETLLLPLDDRLVVTREFIHPAVSRSGLDRCLRRHGVANLKALLPKEDGTQTPVKTFKAYEPGFVHKVIERNNSNQHIPQKALRHKTPLRMLKQWHAQQPHLFKKKVPCNHPGPEITIT